MQWFNTLRSIDYNYTFFQLELAYIPVISISIMPSAASAKDTRSKKSKTAMQARLECTAMHT